MIYASLLLILVAVTLLVLGLTAGSSSLLISSIVASLLAAVAPGLGARPNTPPRRPAPRAPLLADRPPEPAYAGAPASARTETLRGGPPDPAFPDRNEPDQAIAYAAGQRDAETNLTGTTRPQED